LYGELSPRGTDRLHVEAIQSRSRLYRWEIDAHVHHGLHQVLWVGSGPAGVSLEDQRESCSGPLAVVIPPGAVHAFHLSPRTEGRVLTFDARAVLEGEPPDTAAALRELFAGPRLLRLESDAPSTRRLASLFEALADEFSAPDAGGSPVPMWLVRAIVWRLGQIGIRATPPATGRRGAAQAVYTRFLVLLEARHLEHWPISRYANRLGVSPERLNRLTRAETGKSALDLVHERLTREACRRLTYIAAPIAVLSAELGFADPAHFFRFFKRRTGRSPREFRQAQAKAGSK
jgi:AraC family transcriptional activator of pobA